MLTVAATASGASHHRLPGCSPRVWSIRRHHVQFLPGLHGLYWGSMTSARAKLHGDRRTAAWKSRNRLARYAASICLLLLGSVAADARSLEIITERGALTLCANPNALPFASKTGPVPGFQIELGEKIAQQLGVVLAVRADSRASSLASLGSDQRVGVPVGSLVSMTLDKGGTVTSPFVFEDDIVAALANREIEAAAVTPATVGWFNQQHADKPLRLIPAFDNDPDLNWNIAAGLFRPDDKLRQRVDAAIEALLADGTIARIYSRYGIELRPPQ